MVIFLFQKRLSNLFLFNLVYLTPFFGINYLATSLMPQISGLR